MTVKPTASYRSVPIDVALASVVGGTNGVREHGSNQAMPRTAGRGGAAR